MVNWLFHSWCKPNIVDFRSLAEPSSLSEAFLLHQRRHSTLSTLFSARLPVCDHLLMVASRILRTSHSCHCPSAVFDTKTFAPRLELCLFAASLFLLFLRRSYTLSRQQGQHGHVQGADEVVQDFPHPQGIRRALAMPFCVLRLGPL